MLAKVEDRSLGNDLIALNGFCSVFKTCMRMTTWLNPSFPLNSEVNKSIMMSVGKLMVRG